MSMRAELRERLPARRFWVGAAITVALVAWMVHSVDVEQLREMWRNRHAAPLVLAALAYSTVLVCRAIRYRSTGAALDLPRLFTVTSLHGFLNRVLPVRGGELAYGYLVRRLGGGTFTGSMLGLVQIRILDLVAVAGILAIALASYVGDVGLRRDEAIAISVAAFVVCGAGYLAIGPLMRVGVDLLRRWAPERVRHGRISAFLDHLSELSATTAATPKRTRLVLVVASCGAWIAIYLCYWLILRGLTIELPLATVILGASVANLASSLPVTAIGSFGTLEAAWTFAFMALGLERSTAVATAWTVSLMTLVFGASYALVGWAALTRIETRDRESRSRS